MGSCFLRPCLRDEQRPNHEGMTGVFHDSDLTVGIDARDANRSIRDARCELRADAIAAVVSLCGLSRTIYTGSEGAILYINAQFPSFESTRQLRNKRGFCIRA